MRSLLFFGLILCLTAVPALASPARILMLLSYHPELRWSQEQVRGVQDALKSVQPAPELHIEYMDTKRFHSSAYYQDLARLYRNKYTRVQPDLLIACDNNALDFVRGPARDFLGSQPLIFCGINNFSPAMLNGLSSVTGVAEDLSIKETLELAGQLHPRAKKLVVYGVPTKTYALNKQRLMDVAADLGWQERLEFVEGLKLSEIQQQLKQLDATSLVVLISTLLDDQGVALSFQNTAQFLQKNSPVPVYTFWKFFIAGGATGGKVVSGYAQGNSAGKMAARVLAGENPAEIPVQRVSPNPVVFNFPQMKKFGISPQELPPGSRMIDQPEDYWSQHPALAWAGGSAAVLLLLICAVLILDSCRRRRQAIELRSARDFLQNLIDGLVEPLLVIAPDYSVLFSNKAVRAHSSDLQSTFKEHCYGLSHGVAEPCHSSEHPCPLRMVLETHQPARVQHRHLAAGGSKVYCDILASPIFDASGELTCVVESVRDVSGLIEAKNQASSEQARLEVTLKSIGDGVIAVNRKAEVTLLNPVAEALTGWCQDDALGQPLEKIFNIINEESREVLANPVEEVISTGEQRGLASNTLLVHRDGSERAIDDSVSPILDASGALIGVVLVFRDITAEKQAELEQVRAQQIESIGLLAGGIAHDFNNLLMGIQANLELLGRRVPTDERVEKYISQAKRAVERSADLTSQLLTFSKGGEPVREEFSLSERIEEWVSFALLGSNCDYQLSRADNLPPVWADLGQMRQVVGNLVINAKQAMPNGGRVEVSVRIESLPEQEGSTLAAGQYLCLDVADSGPGVAVEKQNLIFNPYYTTKHEGNGLGLATAYSIMRRHNGLLSVTNRKSGGALFSLRLPLRNQSLVESAPHAKTHKPQVSLRLLVMDDEEILRASLETLLTEMGHRPVLVARGEEAIEAYPQDKFDLLILDLTIPGGMGGRQTLEVIATLNPEVLAIASSGYADDPIIANPQQYGFAGALIKPYGFEQLEEVFARILQAAPDKG